VPHALGFALVLVAALSASGEASPQRGDPAARLPEAPGASEYWDVIARLDSGYRVFARFMIANEGLGQQTGVGMGHVVLPDGRVMEFRYARRKGEWKLSADRLRLDIASSTLDLHPPVFQFEIDSNTRGIKVHLHFTTTGSAAWADDFSDARYWTDALQLSAPAEGTFWVRGMREPVAVRGTVALTHAWMNENEAAVARRRIEFFGQAPDVALYVSDLMTPAGLHHHWLVVERKGSVVKKTSDFELTLGAATAATAGGKYPVPGQLLIRESGLTADIRPERLLLRTDPLDGVPQPFRFLLSLKSQPQRMWLESSFQLSLVSGADGAPVEEHGQGTLAVDFLNPLPLPN
jgi:hypothetical protein